MPALLIKRDARSPRRRIIQSGTIKIGSICETDRAPEMRFKWISENGHYGYAETFPDALRKLAANISVIIAEADQNAVNMAAFEALPDHVQDLIIDEKRARFELMREERRTVLRKDCLSVAQHRWEAAHYALDDAKAEINRTRKVA